MSPSDPHHIWKRLSVLCLILLLPAALLAVTLRVTAAQSGLESVVPGAGEIKLSYVVEREIDLSGLAPQYRDHIVTDQDDRLYLAVNTENILAIDLNSGVVTTLPAPAGGADHLALNGDASLLFAVTDPLTLDPPLVAAVDTTASQIVTSTLLAPNFPQAYQGVVAGPGGRVYLAHFNELVTVDALQGAVLSTTIVTDVLDLTYLAGHPGHDTLYALTSNGEFVRYGISNSLPVELYRRQTGYVPAELMLSPDQTSLYARATFWPASWGIGRLTTDSFALQQLITATTGYGEFDVDGANDYFYASLGNAIDVFDVATEAYVGTLSDPGISEHPSAVIGLPGGRVALLYTGFLQTLRILTPATTSMALPVVFHNYCSNNLYDDFSDPASGWPIASTAYFHYRYLNGEYNINHIGTNRWTGVTAGHEWEGRTVQVDGRINAGDGVWGLILGIAPDWSRFFTFEIDPSTQTWYLLSYSNASGWQLVRSGQSASISAGSNRLRASGVNLYINNAYVTDFAGLNAAGRVGFTSAAFAAGSDFRYDDYYFVRQYCPEPPGVSGMEVAPAFIGALRRDAGPGR